MVMGAPNDQPKADFTGIVDPIRRTFTVRMQLDPESGAAQAGQAVDVDCAVDSPAVGNSKDSVRWSGWNPDRLVEFIGDRLAATTASVRAQAERRSEMENEPPEMENEPPENLPGADPGTGTLHRFGMLTAAEIWLTGEAKRAMIELDPADLELPQRRPADVLIQVYAQRLGSGHSVLLASTRDQIALGRPFTTSLDIVRPLGAESVPMTVLAVVRVLVDSPVEPPLEGLGTAVLQLLPTTPVQPGWVEQARAEPGWAEPAGFGN